MSYKAIVTDRNENSNQGGQSEDGSDKENK